MSQRFVPFMFMNERSFTWAVFLPYTKDAVKQFCSHQYGAERPSVLFAKM
jgi:hypothetical protein